MRIGTMAILLMMIIFGAFQVALADDFMSGSRMFETVDEARARHSAQNYDTYKNNNYQAPMGGYSTKLNDVAPQGTYEPGYVNNNSNYNYQNNYGRNLNKYGL